MKQTRHLVTTIIGIALLGAGLALLKGAQEPGPLLRALPYVCIGFGCGVFGHGMGSIIAGKAVQSDPEAQQQMEIEKNDERNAAIAYRSKAKAHDIMTFVFGALMVSFALMGVDLIPLLLFVFAYLFVLGCAVYYRLKYEKEM